MLELWCMIAFGHPGFGLRSYLRDTNFFFRLERNPLISSNYSLGTDQEMPIMFWSADYVPIRNKRNVYLVHSELDGKVVLEVIISEILAYGYFVMAVLLGWIMYNAYMIVVDQRGHFRFWTDRTYDKNISWSCHLKRIQWGMRFRPQSQSFACVERK